MRFIARRPTRLRRGLTLVEMMVTVALLILIMTIVVQIFASATGAMSASRSYQELDQGLRRLDATIRQDLKGVTARMTPGQNDPTDNRGYFEYGENAFADNQGEDADDYVRFTTKAPEGQPFTGRCWLPDTAITEPILITSQFAEVIYFLRNGNLYRRVFLIAPGRQSTISLLSTTSGRSEVTLRNFPTSAHLASWLGVNDLSARPNPVGTINSNPLLDVPILNTLGDLTNRENRAFSPRFANDFKTPPNTNGPDGIPDDLDRDSVPDYYPTLYPLVVAPASNGVLTNDDPSDNSRVSTLGYDTMPFPYIFPGAYSKPAPDPTTASVVQGWIHNLNSSATVPNPLTDNQAPLQSGDSAAPPTGTQTWFGFPTRRETMHRSWSDPNRKVNRIAAVTQSPGLQPFPPNAVPAPNDTNFLPPVTTQPFNDGAGVASAFLGVDRVVWEDDLIMTGVRSFDIKAYDNAYGGYVDLGWGDDIRVYLDAYYTTPAELLLKPTATTLPYLANTPSVVGFIWPPNSGLSRNILTESVAHEGRIPPLRDDNRFDPQFPARNIGDDRPGVIRLRRVWDSWSTDHTRAPASGIDPVSKEPTGIAAGQPPIYPSYPPPYPMQLRGIQIQLRVVDPRNERVKTLTIRQDFSDKL